jgi:hypothetical protein
MNAESFLVDIIILFTPLEGPLNRTESLCTVDDLEVTNV